ncbi:MAG: DNA helicase Rep [Pseudomonadales bacterium]|nr:DNA helicase Rep [Pseudomonadales bacterium]
MNKLNSQQQKALEAISHPCLVLAGAGSGKTSVITRKIAYLVKECGMPAKNIAAVTFTNKAAKEMKERVSALIPGKQGRGILVCTFHTLGLTIIRQECQRLGLKAGFSIFDQEDARTLLKELSLQSGEIETDLLDFVQNTISQLKNDMKTPEQALMVASNAQESLIAKLYLSYQTALTAYNAVDFDDLINIPVKLFQEHPDILEKWQRRIRYMLVDEYQDTNISQYELVRLIVGDRSGLTVVGDDDQSIYAWRGARPENLVQLQTDFPTLELIKLEQNYRSTGIILDSANKLIANNPHVYEKKLWSNLPHGDPIRVLATPNDMAESERVVNEIIAHRLRTNSSYSDYAILYRGNHQARIMEMALRTEDLPYKVSGGQSFFSKSEVKDIMAYLRLIVNPSDDNALLRIINVPRRKIGTSTLQTLSSYANERDISLYDAICEFGLQSRLSKQALERLNEFYNWLQNVMRLCEEAQPINAIEEMIDDIGYEAWLHGNSNSSAAAEKRMQNVRMLVDNVKHALERELEDDDDAGIKEAINRLMLRDMMERQSEEEESEAIQLTTMHASKGLEWPNVYILGMEEELLPHRSSIEENNIEEERRLAYVGITRAKENLTLTYALKRKQFGEMMDTTPSRFLDEIPSEHLVWEGRGEASEELNTQKGKDTFADLKSLLDEF